MATATVDAVEVFTEPGDTGDPSHVLEHPTPIGAPRVFLVDERQGDWLRVLLPVRPNGSTGWIRADQVDLARTRYRVHVDLADFSLRVHEGDDLVVETPIGYGAEDTPTPGGRYYVTELLQPPDPGGARPGAGVRRGDGEPSRVTPPRGSSCAGTVVAPSASPPSAWRCSRWPRRRPPTGCLPGTARPRPSCSPATTP